MYGRHLVVLACFLALPGVAAAQQGNALQTATAALGTTSIRTLQFTASGRAFVLGQPGTAADPWPLRTLKTYQASIDYGSGAMRVEQVLTMPTPAPRGGGGAFTGEQRQVQLVRGAVRNAPPPAAVTAASQKVADGIVNGDLWLVISEWLAIDELAIGDGATQLVALPRTLIANHLSPITTNSLVTDHRSQIAPAPRPLLPGGLA